MIASTWRWWRQSRRSASSLGWAWSSAWRQGPAASPALPCGRKGRIHARPKYKIIISCSSFQLSLKDCFGQVWVTSKSWKKWSFVNRPSSNVFETDSSDISGAGQLLTGRLLQLLLHIKSKPWPQLSLQCPPQPLPPPQRRLLCRPVSFLFKVGNQSPV